jgi:hypothetical protein
VHQFDDVAQVSRNSAFSCRSTNFEISSTPRNWRAKGNRQKTLFVPARNYAPPSSRSNGSHWVVGVKTLPRYRAHSHDPGTRKRQGR